ncbi:transport and Golgi organization protein 6 homolog [Nematostella vectensis]|uniref:transport and Golgi organization protein 6 homolog n=1 Tax=Nematostella vectensis TaxID=45351 RepID=UPI002076F5DF|nr:transport and Golgi organization protein 6 homolog [Nematostella vectensis]
MADADSCPSIVVSAIRLLTSTSLTPSGPKAPQSFDEIISSRLTALKSALQDDKQLQGLSLLFDKSRTSREFWMKFLSIEQENEGNRNPVNIFDEGKDVRYYGDSRWRFVETCLQLLIVLKDVMQELSKAKETESVEPTSRESTNTIPDNTHPTPCDNTDPTPVRPNDPTPDTATDPTPVRATNPTPVTATDPTPVRPNDPTPVTATVPTPVRATNPTPVKAAKGRKAPYAPKLGADALSISDQKSVLTCVQFVVSLGLCPYLLPGIGIPLEKRTGFGELIKSGGLFVRKERHLYKCVWTLLECTKHPTLGSVILSRHLGDVLSGLIQLVFAPPPRQNSKKKSDLNSKNTAAVSKIEKDIKDEQDNLKKETPDIGTNTEKARLYNLSQWEKYISTSDAQNRDTFITLSQREGCWSELARLLNRVYQPMVVRELLVLQGSSLGPTNVHGNTTKHGSGELKGGFSQRPPRWFVIICGQLLSERLMMKNGVIAVLRGILETPGDPSSAPDWHKCEMVSKLLANCPSQATSVDVYYGHVGPQVLKLLLISDPNLGPQFIRVASYAIQLMLKLHPAEARKHVLNIMLLPLARATSQACCMGPGDVVSDEASVTRSIESIHKVFVKVTNYERCSLPYLSNIIHPLFEIFCFTRQGVSYLRSSCQDILTQFLKHSNSRVALKTLYTLAFKEHPQEDFGNTLTTTESNSKTQTRGKNKKESVQEQESKNAITVSNATVTGTKELDTTNECLEDFNSVKLMSGYYSFGHGDSGGVIIKCKAVDVNESADDLLGSLSNSMQEYEVQALCLVELLMETKAEKLAGEFFLHLMKELTDIVTSEQEQIGSNDLMMIDKAVANQKRSLLILHLVALMCEKLGPTILQDPKYMLSFIRATLERACILCQEGQLEAGLIAETVTMVIGMLSAILGGALKLDAEDRELVTALMPLLENLANQNPDTELGAMATDLRIAIATHGTVWSQKLQDAAQRLGKPDKAMEAASEDSSGSSYDEALSQLCDPLLPVRGHAMLSLASLINHRDPKAMSKVDTLLKIFEEQLAHDDSYIYLAAVQGLVALAGLRPDPVLPHLARQFATCRKEPGPNKERGLYHPEKGSGAPAIPQRSPELRMKLGEALVRATRACGPLVPRFSQHLISSLLTGARDAEPMVRASSLSNLGDVCKLLRFSIGPILQEVFSCLSAVLHTDKSEHVRRAATMVITLLLQGLEKDSIEVLGSSLKDIYRLLKLVEATDPDEATRVHAQRALGVLDAIMREFLFPKQTFTKRIQVLP